MFNNFKYEENFDYTVSQDYHKPEKPEKIPAKDIFAIILAQYSILLPIALGACVAFGLILLFIVKVLMR